MVSALDFFLFLRESDIFWWEIIQGFYLGELLRKAKALKASYRVSEAADPDGQLSTWETWRPAIGDGGT